jgi:hypothetical protein
VQQPLVKITQQELADISEMEREVAWRTRRLDEMKSSVKEALLLRVPVEPGRFGARLKTIPFRNVPWKTLVLEKIPKPIIDGFRKLYPVRVRSEVVVVEHATQPLWNGEESQGAIDLG